MTLNTVMLNVYAECHFVLSAVASLIMLSVIMLNVAVLSVVAPYKPLNELL